jgi:hypothetical protein
MRDREGAKQETFGTAEGIEQMIIHIAVNLSEAEMRLLYDKCGIDNDTAMRDWLSQLIYGTIQDLGRRPKPTLEELKERFDRLELEENPTQKGDTT